MRALAIGQIYSNLEKAIYQYNINDICFILDEAVENQVRHEIRNIKNVVTIYFGFSRLVDICLKSIHGSII